MPINNPCIAFFISRLQFGSAYCSASQSRRPVVYNSGLKVCDEGMLLKWQEHFASFHFGQRNTTFWKTAQLRPTDESASLTKYEMMENFQYMYQLNEVYFSTVDKESCHVLSYVLYWIVLS
jgi:hypothetical protein